MTVALGIQVNSDIKKLNAWHKKIPSLVHIVLGGGFYLN